LTAEVFVYVTAELSYILCDRLFEYQHDMTLVIMFSVF